ncbi:hypothetical protein OS493_004300 [Desmophyllum pertusum]|uniref:UvrD-like helicase C-terminal domain-containing protein n=1 Tax=Desmophyllum pertusum TaxID=174260 RepID=A0A9W9ZT09_9CNID|nr:hypothetical protein OS493_004300 [Desmophyllum pertusum]
MRGRGVKAQTYHSFFRWSGQKEWTPERMGQKFVPRVIIWDEVCTVPVKILQVFLEWLKQRGVQVICCGDHGQPPPISGISPHGWLRLKASYYEEVKEDYRAKDEDLKALKRCIRFQSDKVQCQLMRRALPVCQGWDRFVERWRPGDLILASRTKPPKGKKKTDNWHLGYALTVHSSQGLTISSPQKVWIVDDFFQWSNLVYLAVSRVEYMSQLERVVCPPELGSEVRQPISEQQIRKNIQKKLVSYKHQDRDKGREGFNLKVDYVLQLSEEQKNRCAACNIEMLWNYEPKDTQQFSVDSLDNSKGHCKGNVRLTCLECNRKRGAAVLNEPVPDYGTEFDAILSLPDGCY